ncbi:hypothetical protein [Arthrobacter rhizosphaerae]|uniref:hypothetical protein n=1 Tax=Arthrobacter rhizosphaerae TaxID=2855490 RepID=UPI001FF44026|nr:hypothetical protein [Arthrobacter rhizosphaerae]
MTTKPAATLAVDLDVAALTLKAAGAPTPENERRMAMTRVRRLPPNHDQLGWTGPTRSWLARA